MARGTNNTQGGSVFLRIADGKIVETVDAGTPGAIERTTKASDEHPNGRTIWERKDDYVDGIITSIYRREREYKGEVMNSLVIRLKDVDESYQIEIKEGSRYWSSFMMRLPNIKLGEIIRISPYDFTDKEGKRIIGLNVIQSGSKVAPKWDKNNPGDLPQGKQVRVNGKVVWDFYDRDQYLLKVMSNIASKLQAADTAIGGAQGEPVVAEEDDLPF